MLVDELTANMEMPKIKHKNVYREERKVKRGWR